MISIEILLYKASKFLFRSFFYFIIIVNQINKNAINLYNIII